MSPDEQVAAAPRRKALPFKRTVARKQQSSEEPRNIEDDEDNGLELFRHAKEVFPEILREAEEAEQQQQQHDRKRRKLSTNSPDRSTPLRKQSTTLDDSDDDLIMDVKGKGKEILRARAPLTPVKPASAMPKTPGSNRTTSQGPTSRRAASPNPAGSPAFPVTIIDSDDDDDDPVPVASTSQPRKQSNFPAQPESRSSSPIEILPSDPSLSPTKPTTTDTQNPTQDDDDFREWVDRYRAMEAAKNQKAVVQVIVTSPLTGDAKPIFAKFRLNQEVKLLLTVWTAQTRAAGVNIPEDVEEGLFLTWKGNKIYRNSTLASLGVEVDAQGNLKGAGVGGRGGGEGFLKGGIHLEVWTEEAYAEYLANRGKERALMLGDGEDGVDGLAGESAREEDAPPSPVQQKKKRFRIVLKAKDHEPLKLTAREETNVEALVAAFRKQRDIEPEWDVAIWFDGEKLDEDALVTDLDIDEDEVNQLEVHVKKAGR
jgi:hypothetical protein